MERWNSGTKLAVMARRYLLKVRAGAGRLRGALTARLRDRRPTLQLDDVERRLQLLLTGMYGRAISISGAESARPNWIERLLRSLTRDPRAVESTPGIEGETIRLPVALSSRDGIEPAVARYRLLAIEQAERIERGTASYAPLHDPIECDLYLLREGLAVDAHIARAHPGIADTLVAERRGALERRPKLDILTRPERDVELLVREGLSADPRLSVSVTGGPAESLAWARETAARIREERVSYRGLPPATLWGTVHFSGDAMARSDSMPKETPPPSRLAMPATSTGWNRSQSRSARLGTSETPDGASAGKMLDPFAAPDAHGPENPNGRELEDIAASQPNSDSKRAATGREDSASGVGNHAAVAAETPDRLPPAVRYPEWNSDTGRYLPRAVAVRLHDASAGDDAWSVDMLRRHAALVRQVRHQFERLRARRVLLGRQRAGDDLDLAACVGAIVDRRIGYPPDDRLYADVRPARRGIAISLLVDVSGSTETPVLDGQRVIDLEKIALLLASEALDALGDLYSVSTFAGKGTENVKLTSIKNFRERGVGTFRRRVAAIEPGGFTRLGAAVRHATQELAHQSAGHRLLLILSDGRPNDVDQYQGSYGIEDSRQAIFEARASGIFPFCLTVDRQASEYLPRIFGQTGHTILQRPAQLPTALLGAVRTLIKRS